MLVCVASTLFSLATQQFHVCTVTTGVASCCFCPSCQQTPPLSTPLLPVCSAPSRSCCSTAVDCNVVASWGRGEDGQLGHGDAEQCVRPKAIAALVDADVSSICCGAEYTVAVSNKHKRVYSWGW